jgi:NNP family nitrate/nitrite transporter-like MFS transporter
MNWSEFRKAGHWPTLLLAFLYFDVSFMVWVVLGPLSLYLSRDLGLSLEEKFGLVAIPILAGALLRIPLGMLADHLGPKRAGLVGQTIVAGGLAYAWLFGLDSKLEVELFGVVLGLAGASFAVALPQASRWYPPKFQGLVMGIAGAGNMGVVLDSLFVPWLAERFGWQAVFGFLLVPVLAVLALYAWLVRDAPAPRTPAAFKNYAAVLGDPDTWWFMFFYSITFGGFVGLGNALPLYFTHWYHVSGIAAGLMVALVVFAGSMCRPVGGWVADRIGGIRALQILFGIVALAYFVIAFLPEPGPAAREAFGRRQGERLGLRRVAGGRVVGRRGLLHRGHGARHGQWRGVPTRTAALPQRARGHDRARRGGRRDRRVLPRQGPRLVAGSDRRLRGGILGVLGARRARAHGAGTRQDALAHDLGRGLGRAGLGARGGWRVAL